MRVGGLFSGIGGIELGLQRAGMTIAWHCEADPYAQAVLERHWPGVPCYPDVTTLKGADVEPVDLLCGGFPCQDLSYAGRGAGLAGARSGLWSEVARLTRELRPRYVLLENVSALLSRGLGTVLGDLAEIGYDAEWDCIPASAVGAPHQRDRIWIVAYPNADGRRLQECTELDGEPVEPGERTPHGGHADGLRDEVADAQGARLEGAGVPGRSAVGGAPLADSVRVGRLGRAGELGPQWRREPADGGWWATEPDVGRMAHGVPRRVDRLRALGNAVVPQIPELIGRRILEWEAA